MLLRVLGCFVCLLFVDLVVWWFGLVVLVVIVCGWVFKFFGCLLDDGWDVLVVMCWVLLL